MDLVGHDWGDGSVVRLVSTRSELVRSWVTDAAELGHADFQWHQFANIWQTPGAGEAFVEQGLARPVQEQGGVSELLGVPHDHAGAIAGQDRAMVGCILALYRSAVGMGREWAAEFRDAPAPGLVVVPLRTRSCRPRSLGAPPT